MESSFKMYSDYGVMDSSDEFKEMILDTNRYLFILGVVVSVFHTLFEFLALKNGKKFAVFIDFRRYSILKKCQNT